MSRIDDLIRQHCPNGVEYRALGEVASYSNRRVDAALLDETTFVGVDNLLPEKRGRVDASYRPNTSALTAFEPGAVLLGNIRPYLRKVWLADREGGCSGDVLAVVVSDEYRLRLIPRFLYYLLSSEHFFAFNTRHSRGAKMPRGDKQAILGFRIPMPPVEVQMEIVRVLDLFQSLEAELEAELEARRRQYAYYRDSLLSFERERVRWMTLGEIGTFFGGLTGKTKADFDGGSARYVSYLNVFSNIAADVEPRERVRIASGECQNALRQGDILFTGSSETPDECGMSSVVTVVPPTPLYLNSFCIGFRLNNPGELHPEFSKHLFRAASMRQQIVKTANGVTRFNVSKVRLARVGVPIPTQHDQIYIANILDQFDALVNDLSVGLPAELAARRKQYEHYRDRLLSFEGAA